MQEIATAEARTSRHGQKLPARSRLGTCNSDKAASWLHFRPGADWVPAIVIRQLASSTHLFSGGEEPAMLEAPHRPSEVLHTTRGEKWPRA